MTFLPLAIVESVLLSAFLPQTAPQADPPKRPSSSAPIVIDSAELARFIDPLISAQMTKEEIPGAVFILVQNGRVIYQRGYGFANLRDRTPVDPEKTIWRIGSISKVFTANAIVQLADRGKLRMTDDVNRYLRKVKVPQTFSGPVTFHHLLTHTAGFDEIRPGTRADTQAGLLPLGDFLAPKLVRLRPPGRVISYSTYGITLAGYLVEQISGLDFETYMARNIWRPLGMFRTNIVVPDSLQRDLAIGYELANGVNTPASWEWYHTTPASSMNGTAADMGRFMIAHLQNGRYGKTRILSESATRNMHRQQATTHPQLAGFAYGFQETVSNGERLLQHGGNVEGFSAQMTLIPADGIGFFIATQHEPAALRDVVQQAFFNHYFPVKDKPKPSTPMAGHKERVQRFAGTYELNQFCHTCGENRRQYFRVEVKANADGTISITGNPEPFVEVAPLVFRSLSGRPGAAVFSQDAEGRITQLAGDSWFVFERIK